MSIDSNIGMALNSIDLSASAVGTLSGGVNNASTGATGESVFQKLITQVIGNGNTVSGTGTTVNSGTAQKEENANTLLSGLIFGNGNLAKLKLQITGNSSSESDGAGQLTDELLQDDSQNNDLLDDSSLEAMQAMMAGSTNVLLINQEGFHSQLQNNTAGTGTVSMIGEVQTDVTGLNGTIENSQNSIASEIESTEKMIPLAGSVEAQETTLMASAEATSEFTSVAEATESTNKASSISDENIENTVSLIAPTNAQQFNLKVDKLEQPIPPEGITSEGDSSIVQDSITETDTSLQTENSTLNDNTETESDNIDESLASEYQSQLQRAGITDTTAVNQTAQSVDQTEAYSQISEEILSKLEQKSPTEFKMQLQPQDLGQIDISLKLSEGKLIIDIVAENSKTQALLTSQVDKLVSSMGLQNVKVESVQVSQQMNSDSQNSQNQGYQMNSGMNFSQGRQNSQETSESFQQSFFGTQSDVTAQDVSSIRQTRSNLNKLDYVI